MTRRSWSRRLSTIGILAGGMMLMYVGFVMVEARTFQSTFHVSDTPSAEAVAASSTPIPVGTALGEMRIPRIGMAVVIAQGDTRAVLRRGAGHLADSSWLGQPGNIVVAGHRDTVFRGLSQIRIGDVISVASADRQAWYSVASTAVVAPDDLSVLKPSTGNTLTLITCYPFGFFGAAPERFVVRATEIR